MTETASQRRTGIALVTAAAVAWSLAQGAAVIRAHDVAAMSQVARMIEAIQFDK